MTIIIPGVSLGELLEAYALVTALTSKMCDRHTGGQTDAGKPLICFPPWVRPVYTIRHRTVAHLLRTFLTCYGHKTQPRQQRNRAIDTTQCTVKPCSQQTNWTELKCSSQPCSQSTSWVVTLTLATNNASCNWVNLVEVNQSINLLKAKGPIGHLHRRSVQFSLFLPWTRLNMQKKQRHKLFSWHGTVVRGGMLV